MTFGHFQSLQFRLALPLAALYVAATAIAVGVLIYQAYDTAGSLNDRELSLRADDLARAISTDDAGKAHLNLPPKLASAYAAAAGDNIFAIRDSTGSLIAALPDEFSDRTSRWPPATDEPNYFRLNLGSNDYYGLSVALPSAAGPVSVSVARAAGSDALIHSLLREFVSDVAWISPFLMIATLAIGIFVIRNGLKPVREISRMASAIGPNSTSVRLPDKKLPTEILPLVASINRALDRLEQGFAVQREFTANAAHELRTPLAIITSALDSMGGNGERTKLRNDVARMNRLVEQLLRAARLDAVELDFGIVDLNKTAASVVTTLAPWAIARQRTIALVGSEKPVEVRANVNAVEDALRNLIENAVVHTAPGTEVTVTVLREGCVEVGDRGPGVPRQDREQIFHRFWRGRRETNAGAGLGLSIVKEIMRAHRGRITVEDNSGGGALFGLHFSLVQ